MMSCILYMFISTCKHTNKQLSCTILHMFSCFHVLWYMKIITTHTLLSADLSSNILTRSLIPSCSEGGIPGVLFSRASSRPGRGYNPNKVGWRLAARSLKFSSSITRSLTGSNKLSNNLSDSALSRMSSTLNGQIGRINGQINMTMTYLVRPLCL